MTRSRNNNGPVESRLIALCASLVFSIPTAVLIWLWTNMELARYWGSFLSSDYLIACIIIFAVLALLLPRLFPSILGSIWRGMLRVWDWWGW